MKRNCPLSHCSSPLIIKDGTFKRSSDSRRIQRFRCKSCSKRFSSATGTLEVYQKKRRVNFPLKRLLCSGVSMRRCAILLNVSRRTVERKLIYLGKKSRRKNQGFLEKLSKHKVTKLQFDDLITKECTKLKPLSVSLAVDSKRRFLLGARVSQIPSFGLLAPISRKKYGHRPCHHRKGLERLFRDLPRVVSPHAHICSDEHNKYPEFVARYFPRATYSRFKSERACVAGQGELKKVKRDPLFMVNHACATLREDMARLSRKTWCITKNPQRLQDHLDIFMDFFNSKLLSKSVGLTPI